MVDFTINTQTKMFDNKLIWVERNGPLPENEYLRIIAKINNLDAWNQLKNVNFGSTILNSQGEWIVTATIIRNQLEIIYNQPFVITMEISQKIEPVSCQS